MIKPSMRRLFGASLLAMALLTVGGCGVPAMPADLLAPPSPNPSSPDERFLQLLPEGARLLAPVRYGDVDRDGETEAIIVYEENGPAAKKLKAALVKKQQDGWQIVWATNGFGYGLNYAGIHDMDGDGQPEILLGWSLGAGGNGLDIYEWMNHQWLLRDTRQYKGPIDSSLPL